ncbi:MAG: RNA-binding protein [Bacteroidetes bacterium]|nr:RNA-binding protein [Bacteroidota bacterium]
MNIFVAKLSSSTTTEDLREIFSEFGEVTKASVILDRDTGEPRGFGFVDMPDADSARNAIKTLDGANIHGRNIVVKEADDRRSAGAPSGGAPREGGFRPGGDGGSREGGYRPSFDRGGDRGGDRGSDRGGDRGADRGGNRPGGDREGGFRPGADRGSDRGNDRGGYRDGGYREGGAREGGFRPGADRPFERSSERSGFPPTSAPDSDGDFRKPSRFGKGKEADRKKGGDWEKRAAPKKSTLPPPKKGPKKSRSLEDFEDDF